MSRDPSEITLYGDLLLKKQFLFLPMLNIVVLLNIFVETRYILVENNRII